MLHAHFKTSSSFAFCAAYVCGNETDSTLLDQKGTLTDAKLKGTLMGKACGHVKHRVLGHMVVETLSAEHMCTASQSAVLGRKIVF